MIDLVCYRQNNVALINLEYLMNRVPVIYVPLILSILS